MGIEAISRINVMSTSYSLAILNALHNPVQLVQKTRLSASRMIPGCWR